jgi:16S rRNA (cytidine1402-2'-O)-methyltransferase
LRQVNWIAAEDTRHTGKLLKYHQIDTQMISFHEYSKQKKHDRLMELLDQGDLALVSDAGTPLISDPGYGLVQRAYAAGHSVTPIPGPSAPISALIASGLPSERFVFLGYLPRKMSERRQVLSDAATLPYTLIFFETPHRLLDSLEDLLREFGDRQIVVGREITKLHEEFFRGSISSALSHFTSTPPRGEFTLVVAGNTGGKEIWSEAQVKSAIKNAKSLGTPPAQIASQIATESDWPRRKIYQLIIEMD